MSQNNFKRWYDYDPTLLKVTNILKDYQDELKQHAVVFLNSVESQVSKETLNKFYEMVRPANGGSRWYDKDPVIFKTIELLRVIPKETQRKAAEFFLNSLKEAGVPVDKYD